MFPRGSNVSPLLMSRPRLSHHQAAEALAVGTVPFRTRSVLVSKNALQPKAVLPYGTYITANRCQNQDAYYALRGSGGNAVGFIMEMSTIAHPKLELQVAYIRFLLFHVDPVTRFCIGTLMSGPEKAGEATLSPERYAFWPTA